ncbi:iron ABC transporter permease [Georgenia wutianyii]|uniref:Iron ABC transporter permease n=1 Tax=Georgenia wutianyii TaxID=2585135 RepID=A0ABX5VRB5_9MICO|nr:iron ABC transporter permease [Georgenia wutianyii]QDB79105.1 iron ABC transporter permease [Georgenia wutianyii]
MTQLDSPSHTTTTAHPVLPRRRSRRALWLGGAAALALVLAVLLSVGLGTLRLDPLEAVRAALVAPDSSQVSTVVWSIRLPRIVVAVLVGGALAGVGVVMQAVFRNPLADPGVTGVSSGAAVGAVAGITLGLGGSLQWGVPLAAFAGSLAVALALQAVLHANRGASTYTLILVGVSINAFAGAVISVLVANAKDDALARGAVFWLAGDLELRTWNHAAMAVVPIVLGLALLLTRTRALDALLLGDDVAATSGYDVHRTRLVLLLVASLVTGAAVAVSGVISFVGLVVPHAVRLVIGAKHSLLLPISVVCGSLFLVLADTAARAVSTTAVVQTGAVSAVVGAPVFLALLLSRRTA